MIYPGNSSTSKKVSSTYTGMWKNGIQEGQGVMVISFIIFILQHYENGDSFEGEWKNGKRSGQGKLRMLQYTKYGERGEDVYVGSFENDLMHGKDI
jgi:hypothetical protein